jgi:hypothetical protein
LIIELFQLLIVVSVDEKGTATCRCKCEDATVFRAKYEALKSSKRQGVLSCCPKCRRRRRRGIRIEGRRV